MLIGDRFGRVIAEASPGIGPLPWRLNEITKTTLAFAKTDPKTTADNLRYGNRVLVQFDDDVGLPDWGGTMEPARDWKTAEVAVTCYSIEYLLQFRDTARTRAFDSVPVGHIFYRVLQEAEEQQSLGITFGPVWTGGALHYPRYHFKSLWWILHDSLIQIEHCDFRFVPQLVNGHIVFQAELYEELGEDKSGRWALKEGKNVTDARVTEQGPLVNEFTAVGAGTTWGPDRAVSIAREETSSQMYGLRQDGRVFAGVTQQTTLDRHAITEVEKNSYPHMRVGLEVANVPPAEFRRYEVGDVLRCILPSYDFDGFDENVRILAREYEPGSGRCKLVAEKEQVPDVLYAGPGSENIEE